MSGILAVGSPKGGVGKTTLAVHLAAIAARTLGLRVLLVDADSNHSALDWAGRANDDVLPIDIAGGDAEPGDHLVHLRRARGYDLTVVDLPGAREGAFEAMLRGDDGDPVADLLLAPTTTEVVDLRPVVRVITREVAPLGLDYLMVLTKVATVALGRAERRREELRTDRGLTVADTLIRAYGVYPEAIETDATVMDIPGRYSYARVAELELYALAAETFDRLGLDTQPLHKLAEQNGTD